ncbi:Synaptogenesis protein syg-2 [Araneus ventricosus]|uniref:Synaptogenesis protein syg-2 n=1 Tax=Araneus ventricosus TaxID=182803 RepID=A0A4Y2A4F9_ARAVE|nr:Synaptogenesis protein syg-2 [Araneus ventricosus]
MLGLQRSGENVEHAFTQETSNKDIVSRLYDVTSNSPLICYAPQNRLIVSLTCAEASRTTVRREGEKLYSTLSSITLYPKGDTSGSTYTCEALHPALEKPLKTTVCVGVLYPPRHPEIKGYQEGDLIHAGDHLSLTCSSTGGKPPAELQWLRNGDIIQGSFSTVGRDSANTISFTVQRTDNNAVYTCAASNPLTPVPLVTAVKLSVVFSPSFILIDGPSEGNRGDTITLTCRSDVSNPPTELTWLVDGVTFEPQDTTFHSVENGWYTTSNLTAIITRQNKNIKVFTCIAQNSPRHEKVFQTFNVSILYPPEAPTIIGYDDNTELREGDHQSFTCSALAGNPPAELRWYRGDIEVCLYKTSLSPYHHMVSTDNELTPAPNYGVRPGWPAG